jgi:hypothetical protein
MNSRVLLNDDRARNQSVTVGTDAAGRNEKKMHLDSIRGLSKTRMIIGLTTTPSSPTSVLRIWKGVHDERAARKSRRDGHC